MIKHSKKRAFIRLMTALATISCAKLYAGEIKGLEVCARVKACASQSLNEQEMAEQAKQVLLGQLDKQCAESFAKNQRALIDAGLEDQANACADDMIAMPCDTLLAAGGAGPKSSKACQALDAASEKAGIKD